LVSDLDSSDISLRLSNPLVRLTPPAHLLWIRDPGLGIPAVEGMVSCRVEQRLARPTLVGRLGPAFRDEHRCHCRSDRVHQRRRHGDTRPELAYRILPGYHEEGYGTDAVALAVDVVSQERHHPAVEARTFLANEPSRGLLESLGFTLDGPIRNAVY
jgi:RimJ/RimL family protein N-acetyltransferase